MLLMSELLARYGDVDHDAAKDLETVALDVKALGRKGSVTLTFEVSPAKNRVQIDVRPATKPPKADAEVHLFHVGPDGITTDDQYQGRLDPTTGEISPGRHPHPDTKD